MSKSERCAFWLSFAFVFLTLAAAAETRIEVGLLGVGPRRTEMRPDAENWILGEIRSFQKANTDIVVDVLEVADRREHQPIEQCPSLPRGVLGICSESGYEVNYLVNRQELVPIDDFLPDPQFSKEDFYANLWEPVTYKGKIWGVPWATTAMVLQYDEKLFREGGFAGPPEMWDEFMEIAQKLTKDTDGDGQIDQAGCEPVDQWTAQYLTGHLAMQMGVRLYTDQGFAPYDQKMENVFQLVRKIVGFTESLSAGKSGLKYAMGFRFTRGAPLLEPAPNTRLAFLPTCGEEVLANFDTLYLAIRRGAPEQEQAAWRLVKWISRSDVAMPRVLGGYPARKDFINREGFKRLAARWYPNLDLLWRANERLVDFGPCPMMGRYAAMEQLANSIGFGALTGSEAKEAWDAAAKQLNEAAKLVGPGKVRNYELFK